ncbi:MAG TPA: YidC/Oxa1 family membrane protein insertase [Pseudonocardiaceae bacterium]|nr:YidC/Oxa1 family membrane protein insertase [Pseudonocardiaceae bacterium]
MFSSLFGWLDVPVAGAFHLINPVVHALHPWVGGASIAVTIVLFTGMIRLLLLPLSRAAVRGERARATLAPRIEALRKRHKGNPQRLQAELATLHREANTSMFAGCLPMLAQAPFLSIMYRLFTLSTVNGRPNTLQTDALFGVPYNEHLLAAHTGLAYLIYLVIFLVLATVATLSIRWTPVGTSPQPGGRLLRYLPYYTVAVAAILPLAGGIYLATTTTWTVVERRLLHRQTVSSRTNPALSGR